MKVLIPVIFAFLTSNSFGQWTPRAQKAVNWLNALSLGGFARPVLLYERPSTPILSTGIEVITANQINFGELFTASPIGNGIYWDRSKETTSSVAVVLPGIFMSADLPTVKTIRKQLLGLKRNVVSVSNPMNRERIYGIVRTERTSLVEPQYEASKVMRELHDILKTHSRIDLVGQSYGCFLALELAYLLKNSDLKSIPVSLTLLYPPTSLRRTLNYLEGAMRQRSSWSQTLKTVASFSLSPAVGDEYQNYLATTLYYLDPKFARMFSKMSENESSSYISKLTFFGPNETVGGKSLIETYTPEFLNYLKSPRESLFYHLPAMSMMGIPFRIISSKRDFINDPDDWKKMPKEFSSQKNLLLLERMGSHRMNFMDSIDLKWSDILRFEE